MFGLVLCVTVCLLSCRYATGESDFSQYVIIGAGPGGLQSAALLNAKQRDYRIIEAGPSVGTFYRKYVLSFLVYCAPIFE